MPRLNKWGQKSILKLCGLQDLDDDQLALLVEMVYQNEVCGTAPFLQT